MTTILLSEVSHINELLKKQQERFNSFKPIPHLSNYMPNAQDKSYAGSCDEITSLVEQRLDFIENRRAVLDDALFLLHNIIKKFVGFPIDENTLIPYIKVLEKNKHILMKRIDLLKQLDTLYKCLVIEPAIINISDGERSDPNHFRVIIDPISSLSPTEAKHITTQWWQELKTLEQAVVTAVQLQLLNPPSDE